jgi:hypothetical protein
MSRPANSWRAVVSPESTSTQMVRGESWMQFSFNMPWVEGQSIVRFVAVARQRFAQNE